MGVGCGVWGVGVGVWGAGVGVWGFGCVGSSLRESLWCGGSLRGADFSRAWSPRGRGVSGEARWPQGAETREGRVPCEAERPRQSQGPHEVGSPRGVGGGLMGGEAHGVWEPGGRSTHGRRRLSRARAAAQSGQRRRFAGPAWVPSIARPAEHLPAVTAFHRGGLAAGRACRASLRSCQRSLPDGLPAERLRRGTRAALVSPRRASSGHGRSSCRLGDWRAAVLVNVPGRAWSGRSGRRRRTGQPGTGLAPSIGARPGPPTRWDGGRIKPWPGYEGDRES